MAPVVSRLSTSLVAVPALRRVEPVTTSGPTGTVMQTSQVSRISCGGSVQLRKTVRAPRVCARPSAARTNGVVPLAAMPTTTSFSLIRRSSMAAMPALRSSSAPSMDFTSAGSPPAMIPCTISGGEPKVGGHSEASSTPSRPLVPAPT